MKIAASLMILGSLPVMAETVTFDQDAIGSLPVGWTAGVTGRGAQRCTVEADVSAPSKPKVLKQSGLGDFPWCVKDEPQFADGYAEVKRCKARYLRGGIDGWQSAGQTLSPKGAIS